MAENYHQPERSRQINGRKIVTVDSCRVPSYISHGLSFVLFQFIRIGMLFEKRLGYEGLFAQKFESFFCKSYCFYIEF